MARSTRRQRHTAGSTSRSRTPASIPARASSAPGRATSARGSRGRARALQQRALEPRIDINLNGIFATARAAARHMRPRGFGRIVITTSLAATKVEPAIGSAYMAAKAGARHFMHCLAMELAADGITANAIAPASSSPTSAAVTPTTPRSRPRSRGSSPCTALAGPTTSSPLPSSSRRRRRSTSPGRRSSSTAVGARRGRLTLRAQGLVSARWTRSACSPWSPRSTSRPSPSRPTGRPRSPGRHHPAAMA